MRSSRCSAIPHATRRMCARRARPRRRALPARAGARPLRSLLPPRPRRRAPRSALVRRWLVARRRAAGRRGGGGAEEPAMNAGTLAHALDRLANTGRVLYVAAHPDDENTRLLAYLANERHVGAAYLSMTRGGGGQNLIGAEQGELLDVIRTEELLAARRLDGAEQRFTRMRDFGYSKSADETLAHLGPRRGARRRRLGDPHLPARRHHHALRRAAAEPRPPHGLGDPRARGVRRRRRPAALSRAARARRRAVAGGAAAAERPDLARGAAARRTRCRSTSAPTTRASASATASWRRARAASTRARASASPASAARSSSAS